MAMLFSRAVYAQVSTVTGTVTDPQQEPLTGVVVTEKGNPANGVITDIDGKYSLKCRRKVRLCSPIPVLQVRT
ncbi:hypothetical protein [uncultured Duncaniella sp.]|uniref:hypothetical protein n=1 Tax=uncultured Duncaniella sp. TaxID=2768039 RepID=UPI002729804E|nr:hypothetical protein [uncultured Duncaniella sp.]